MHKLLAISLAAAGALAATAAAGAAQAQAYAYGRPAYDDGGHRHGGGFTLLGARAGVTVLGVDFDGSGGLRIGLHDHRGGGGHAAYTQPPVEYGPPETYGPPESYGPTPAYASGYAGYGDLGYAPAPPSYESYGAGGYGYAYGGQPSYAYRPCGC